MQTTELPPEWAAAVRRFNRKRDAKALAWAVLFGVILAVVAAIILAKVLSMGSNYPVGV